jgi:hypothetical protein
METIMDYLKRKLREAGPARWGAIAAAAGVAKSLPRKLAYEDRSNPGVQTVQPLLDLFYEVDRGGRELPEAVPAPEDRRVASRPNAFPDLDRRAPVGGPR